ncbi:MAG: ATP-dependent DNA helicase RecG, partial [Deltaproteobacteria bacterium]|nr:ATP-dependent DNA helicase RecG [Deltaproteobacteria bacterium]
RRGAFTGAVADHEGVFQAADGGSLFLPFGAPVSEDLESRILGLLNPDPTDRKTVEDLLYHLPFRYQDRREIKKIRDLVIGEEAATVGEIVRLNERFMSRSRRWVLEGVVRDETGFLFLLWYHQVRYFQQRYHIGQRVLLYGRVEMGMKGGKWMIHPDMEPLEEGAETARILPVYNKTTEMTAGAMRRIVHRAVEEHAAQVPTALPAEMMAHHRLMDLASALRFLHLPPLDADIAALNMATSAAHRSVVFDELFYLQLGMVLRKGATAKEEGLSFTPGPLTRRLREILPFVLTGAQERVLAEIFADMAVPHPMNRLVQGDVGSGKTIVAFFAALVANDGGYQVALMAPTELLAEQHYSTLSALAGKLSVPVVLLTGEVKGKKRQEIYDQVRRGEVALVIGTHALIQEGVEFCRLGLGIVDEQHRFGVMQRAALKRLGENLDILLMTATPIPRTLALTLYGDLDVSLLDELPPGRKPVTTQIFHEGQRERVYRAVKAELDQGHQAYVIYPLVEESSKSDLKAATTMAQELSRAFFVDYRVGLVHGRMKGEEKDGVMRRFKAGEYQLLVSTTVIEVGIDVPNSTVMVIEHAERFGLAQLHQLRGRVGRGESASSCYLLAQYSPADDAHRRLQVMVETNDGFRIAEADLAFRGPGEFLGTRQSGLPDFRVANIVRDSRILEAARHEALHWLERDPDLALPASRRLRRVLEDRWAGRLELARVG